MGAPLPSALCDAALTYNSLNDKRFRLLGSFWQKSAGRSCLPLLHSARDPSWCNCDADHDVLCSDARTKNPARCVSRHLSSTFVRHDFLYNKYFEKSRKIFPGVTSENLCQRQEGVLAMWFCRLTKGAPPCRTRQRSGVYRVHLLS